MQFDDVYVILHTCVISKRHSKFGNCHGEKLISFPLSRMTSPLPWLGQSDRPDDLNILVHPIRTSKCPLVQCSLLQRCHLRSRLNDFPRSCDTLSFVDSQPGFFFSFFLLRGKCFSAQSIICISHPVQLCFEARYVKVVNSKLISATERN